MNLAYEKDVNADVHVSMDVDKKEVKRADVTLHFRNTGAGNFYVRGDAMSKYFGFGHHDKTGDLTHVAEV
jgi:hypothetical protein